MPIHTLASAFGTASSSQLVLGGATLVGVYSTKVWAGGKRSAWERDWAGKMILIVVSAARGTVRKVANGARMERRSGCAVYRCQS